MTSSTQHEGEVSMHSGGSPHNVCREGKFNSLLDSVSLPPTRSFNNISISDALISIICPPDNLPKFFPPLPPFCSHNLQISALTSKWISECGIVPGEGGSRLCRLAHILAFSAFASIYSPPHCAIFVHTSPLFSLLPFLPIPRLLCFPMQLVSDSNMSKGAVGRFAQWWQWRWVTAMVGVTARTSSTRRQQRKGNRHRAIQKGEGQHWTISHMHLHNH